MRRNQTKQTSSEEPTTSNPYDLRIAQCKGSRRMEREVKALTTVANMTLTGEVLMEALPIWGRWTLIVTGIVLGE